MLIRMQELATYKVPTEALQVQFELPKRKETTAPDL
jgi:hypothetical protein